jgi:vanillate O-demethylase monooxygenase subunit
MTFIKNLWYVAAWSHELGTSSPIARMIVGEPLALFRKSDGSVVVFEDRCPHRHAPLSLGRVENDELRCMYHGLRFSSLGVCVHIPGSNVMPPNTSVRTYPVMEKSSWIWVWMGRPELADASMIPEIPDIGASMWATRSGTIDYAADYQLVHDNLCDLSHVDYSHETTLGAGAGKQWSANAPPITRIKDGLLVERWITGIVIPDSPAAIDSWLSYRFVLPGLFLMRSKDFPAGTAAANAFAEPQGPPLLERFDQQAVTPVATGQTRYLFASAVEARCATPESLEADFAVTSAAFEEDRRMIEGQQRIWNVTSAEQPKAFIPADKAPAMFRRIISNRLADENRDAGTPQSD